MDNKRYALLTPSSDRKSREFIALLTFADLMSLLLVFFILLFALSDVNKHKFNSLNKSIQFSFGNQFLGKTVALNKDNYLDSLFWENLKNYFLLPQIAFPTPPEIKPAGENEKKEPFDYTRKMTQVLKYIYASEIGNSYLSIQQINSGILIEIADIQAFKSGSADFTPIMQTILVKLGTFLNGTPGKIIISGHTDNVPISNEKYRSNWELSAARAYSVIDFLVNNYPIEKQRIHLEAYADTKNLVPNDTAENRSKNRRIEIFIDQKEFYDDEWNF